ncbi:MAG TPA: hypothetical protein PKX40_04755 [Spirochaetota bacterium]|nr:hypothetical protein [Spirochaetota bacterium]
MKKSLLIIAMTVLFSAISCVTTQDAAKRIEDSKPAAEALRAGKFTEALNLSGKAIGRDGGNCYAFMARAIARYVAAGQRMSVDIAFVRFRGSRRRGIDLEYLREAVRRMVAEFVQVDSDLEKASRCDDVFLDLAPALWMIDWNGDGDIDSRDRSLLEIELDADGKKLSEDDPRRRPLYRYDVGDVHWARAFVNFQMAALNIALAYDWSIINTLMTDGFRGLIEIRIKMLDKTLIALARKEILTGLECAEQARLAYLAETDDEREWVPNPRQKNHPMPLPVDEELYKTWDGVLKDVRKLVTGEEGLRLADVADLAQLKMDPMPLGYLDFGRMFDRPKDIVINLNELVMLEHSRDLEGMLRTVFGEYYCCGKKPSLITSRLKRMKGEIDRGLEPFGRKLKYLLWLN